MLRILYIYDHEGWALHNVGRYWSGLIEDISEFTFIKLSRHFFYDPRDFDYVFWGCSYMAERYLVRLLHLIIPRRYPLWNPRYNNNFITIVHDPCELFPQRQDWMDYKPRRLSKIRSFKKIGVTSNEMQKIMKKAGIECTVLNTNSNLPLREQNEIFAEPLRIFSRAKDIPRKNIRLFKELQTELGSEINEFNGYFDDDLMSVANYIKLIDMHNCYVCTSWQEGGPLPIMDAMRRGCAVLTTPVGQTDELIIDGVNGFLCKNYWQFKDRIMILNENVELLLRMRREAIKSVSERSDQRVRSQLIEFLTL